MFHSPHCLQAEPQTCLVCCHLSWTAIEQLCGRLVAVVGEVFSTLPLSINEIDLYTERERERSWMVRSVN